MKATYTDKLKGFSLLGSPPKRTARMPGSWSWTPCAAPWRRSCARAPRRRSRIWWAEKWRRWRGVCAQIGCDAFFWSNSGSTSPGSTLKPPKKDAQWSVGFNPFVLVLDPSPTQRWAQSQRGGVGYLSLPEPPKKPCPFYHVIVVQAQPPASKIEFYQPMVSIPEFLQFSHLLGRSWCE